MFTPRRAIVSDSIAVADLYISARKSAIPNIPALVHSDIDVKAWLSNRIKSGDEVWVAENETGLTAMMILEAGCIDQLYVRSDMCGKGLGSVLVKHAKSLQPTGLQLWTFQSNVGAQRFYERNGFIEVERTDGSANEERSPDVRFVWQGSA